jgi:hypothetical protein
MDILDVLLEKRDMGVGTCLHPAIPDGLQWGQASSQSPDGRQRIYIIDATDEVLTECEKRGAKILKAASLAEREESCLMLEKFQSEKVPKQENAKWSARDEIVAMYREPCLVIEAAEARAEAVDTAKKIACWLGIAAGAVFLSRAFGLPFALALTVLHADNFDRADGAIDASTMSDTLGHWTSQNSGQPQIVSNQAKGTLATHYIVYDDVMSAVDVQRATCDFLVGAFFFGPCVRVQTSFNCYHLFVDNSAGGTIYSYNGGFSSLGSAGVLLPGTVSLDASGSTLTALNNGSAAGSPVTDSAYGTGRAGINVHTGPTDNWQAEVAAVANKFRGSLLGTRRGSRSVQ